MTLSGALAIFSVRRWAPLRVLRLGTLLLGSGAVLMLLALQSGLLGGLFVATLVAGCGFGAGFLGALRSTLPLAQAHERAGLMAAYYVLSYLAFSLPALLAGLLVRQFGLMFTSEGYLIGLLALCLLACTGLFGQRSVTACST
ncbi:hypothetical protein D3C80_1399010 [compost metagenome]